MTSLAQTMIPPTGADSPRPARRHGAVRLGVFLAVAALASWPIASRGPDLIGHHVVEAIHASEMAPVIERIISNFGNKDALFFDLVEGPALRQTLMDKVESLNHDGVALIGRDRQIFWSSRPLKLRVDQEALSAVLDGAPIRVFLVEETGPDGEKLHV